MTQLHDIVNNIVQGMTEIKYAIRVNEAQRTIILTGLMCLVTEVINKEDFKSAKMVMELMGQFGELKSDPDLLQDLTKNFGKETNDEQED